MNISDTYRKLRTSLYFWLLKNKNQGKSAEEIFSTYWSNNHWRNSESRSGEGSTLRYTEGIRKEIPVVLTKLNANSVLDAPCGDFNWFKEVRLPDGIKYIGADIVSGMISSLANTYKSENRSFITLDVVNDALPAVDVWLCRDLVFHLPNADVNKLLRNYLSSGIEYLLITSHTGENVENEDTFLGGFRMLNLAKPPFSLPSPDAMIRDYIEGFPERHLLLYKKSSLMEWSIRRNN